MKCNCPRQEELKTVHSYKAGDTGSASELVCPCGKKFLVVKLSLGEIEKHGQGAYATAQRMKRGHLPLPAPKESKDAR